MNRQSQLLLTLESCGRGEGLVNVGGKEGLQTRSCPHVHTGTDVEVGMYKEGEATEETSTRTGGGEGGREGGREGEKEGGWRKERPGGKEERRKGEAGAESHYGQHSSNCCRSVPFPHSVAKSKLITVHV